MADAVAESTPGTVASWAAVAVFGSRKRLLAALSLAPAAGVAAGVAAAAESAAAVESAASVSVPHAAAMSSVAAPRKASFVVVLFIRSPVGWAAPGWVPQR